VIKLKNILNEYLQEDEMYLYKYFKNYKENLFYVIARDYFKSLIEILHENLDDAEIENIYDNELYDYEYVDDFIDYVESNEELKKQVFLLIDRDMSQFSAEYNDIDSNDATLLCMEYEGIYKKNWILHFTSDENAQNILRNGFTYGTSDVERLGLTTWYKKEAKKRGGFNFGYGINTYDMYYKGNKGWSSDFKYGNSCIMAMVSGIRVEHYGDEEEQIIFWGKSASNILRIYDSDTYDSYTYGSELKGGYYVENYKTGKAIYSGDFEDVVDWVVKNHLQYKNVLYRGK